MQQPWFQEVSDIMQENQTALEYENFLNRDGEFDEELFSSSLSKIFKNPTSELLSPLVLAIVVMVVVVAVLGAALAAVVGVVGVVGGIYLGLVIGEYAAISKHFAVGREETVKDSLQKDLFIAEVTDKLYYYNLPILSL